MSAAFGPQVPGLPPFTGAGGVLVQSAATFAAHDPFVAPVAVMQISPAGHCESAVHAPQTLVALQIGVVPAQSVFEQQAPVMHEHVSPVAQSVVAVAQQKVPAPQVLLVLEQLFDTHAPAALHIVPAP